jgi:hypothetical protein
MDQRIKFHEAMAKVFVEQLGVSGQKKQEELLQQRMLLMKELIDAGIDPSLFDMMLARELDRALKKKFGWAFLGATVGFALLSYGIIVFNGIYTWNISSTAITALIAETPLQFIGLLYIIARNLFPQSTVELPKSVRTGPDSRAQIQQPDSKPTTDPAKHNEP